MPKTNVLLALVVVLLLVCSPLGFAQLGTEAIAPHRTLGYYNPDTGLFEPLRSTTQDSDSQTATPTTGTLVFKFTITTKSPVPKNGIIICSAAGAVIETNFSADEGGFGFATLQSGNTYTCSVSMPYSWLLNSPGTDKIILSYKASFLEAILLTATNGTGTVVTSTGGRFSSQTTASIPVPASGAITTENVSVTL